MLRAPFVLLFIFALLNPVDSFCKTEECRQFLKKLADFKAKYYAPQDQQVLDENTAEQKPIGLSTEEDDEDKVFPLIGLAANLLLPVLGPYVVKYAGEGMKLLGGVLDPQTNTAPAQPAQPQYEQFQASSAAPAQDR